MQLPDILKIGVLITTNVNLTSNSSNAFNLNNIQLMINGYTIDIQIYRHQNDNNKSNKVTLANILTALNRSLKS